MRKFKKVLAGVLAAVMTLTTLLPAASASALETGDEGSVSAQRGQVLRLGASDIFDAATVETSTKTTAQNWQWMVTNAGTGSITENGAVSGVNGQYIVCLGEYDLTNIDTVDIAVSSSNNKQIKGNLSMDFTLNGLTEAQTNGSVSVDNSCSSFKVYSGGAWDYGMDTNPQTGTGSGTQLGEATASNGKISIDVTPQTGEHTLYYRQYSPNKADEAATCSLTSITFTGTKTVSDFSDLAITSVSGPNSETANAESLGMTVEGNTFTWNTKDLSDNQIGSYTVSFTAKNGEAEVTKNVSMTLKAAPDAAETVGTTVTPGTNALTAQRGQSITLSGSEVFGSETKTQGFTTDADGWKWMLTESSSGSVTTDGVKDLAARYLIYLGDYDLTGVSKMVVKLGLNSGTTIKGNLFADYTNVDVSNATASSSVNSSAFPVYNAGPWGHGADQTGTQIGKDFSFSGTSTNKELKNYTWDMNNTPGGVHSVYFRVYQPVSAWPGDLASITFVTGEETVTGGGNMVISAVSKDNDPLTQDQWGALGMSVTGGSFVWNTSGMTNDQAGDYAVTFTANAAAGSGTRTETVTITVTSSDTDVSEPVDIPTLANVTTQKGQNVSFTKGEIFGEKTLYQGMTTDARSWQWMSTKSTAGSVTDEGKLTELNARYLIYLGQYNLTGVTGFALKLGLNTSEEIRGNFFVDYGNVNVSGAAVNSGVTNGLNSSFSVYQGDAWGFGADGDGQSLCGTIIVNGTSENRELKDYLCNINNPQEGTHAVYFRTFLPENGAQGNLAGITMVIGEKTIYGGDSISIKSVSKGGQSLTEDKWKAMGMSIDEAEGFVWRTLHMDNADAGTYQITFAARNSTGAEVTNSVEVTVNAGTKTYKHPGILFTTEEIQTMYANYQAGKEPWKSAGEELLADAKATYTLQGVESVTAAGNIVWTDTSSVVNGHGFNNAFRADCQVAYQNTLAYLLTHDKRYADVALNILNTYSGMKPSIQGHDQVFVVSQMAFRLCNAAELLRACYVDESGKRVWQEADILRFQEWIMDEFVPPMDGVYGMANGGISMLKGMLAVGIFCENDHCYDFALNGFFHDANVGVTGAINEFGQNRESGRDQIHSQLIIGHFAEMAWAAYNQDPSLKLFEEGDHRILKGYEYMLKYMMGEEVKYDKDFYSTNYNYSNTISENGRGLLLPIYEFVYNYYVGILRWDPSELPYTSQAVAFTRNEGVSCYNGSYDTYHMIGYGTLNTAVAETPAQVGSVQVTASSGGTASVTWSAAQGAAGYYIYRSNQKVSGKDPAAYPMAWYSKVTQQPVVGTSYQDSGLVAGEGYFYKITAVNTDGQESGCCKPVYVQALEQAPVQAPRDVWTAIVSNDIMKVSWSPVSGAAGYKVYASLDGKSYTPLSEDTVAGTYCYHVGLQPSQLYYYKIQAVNDYGASGLSEAFGARTAPAAATGTDLGTIGIYPKTVTLTAAADVSAGSDGTFASGEASNECVNGSKVSFLKFDLGVLGLVSGDQVDSARLLIYRSGSTSPIEVHGVESADVDYDNWNESADGSSFEKGNLVFTIPSDALTYAERGEKPSTNQSYNSSDGTGVNVTAITAREAASDRVLTLRITAAGTGGSSGMSFHSRHANNNYKPSLMITVTNSAVKAYEQEEHEQLPEEVIPDGADKSALTAAIAKAEALKASDYTSNSWTALASAVAAGQTLLAGGDATQEAVNAAAQAIEDAINALVKAGGGTGGSTGSNGGNAGSNTSTTTNPDGSTTTRTENKTTGTVTETTKNTDGSTTVVETKKDGTVTTTDTDKEGNKTATVAKPDGSSETKVNNKDGSTSTTAVDTEGKVKAEVKLTEKAVETTDNAPVALPMPEVPVTRDRETAPTVTVSLPSGSESVKVEIPVENVTPGSVAIIVKADGTEEIVKTSVTTENGVAVTLSDGDTVKIVDNSKKFEDVDDSHWGCDAVDFASSRELFNGTSETTFSPDTSMTRGMLMTVLARFDGADTEGGEVWYEKGMEWAVANNVSDGSDPNGSITREQMIAMIWRYAGSPASEGSIDSFADASNVSDYAVDALKWAVSVGLINGTGNNSLTPKGSTTRAQVATLLMRYVELIAK